MRRLLPVLILLLHFALGLTGMGEMSLTLDEGFHLRYGENLLAGQAARFDDSKMPVTVFNALGLRATGRTMDEKGSWLEGLTAARSVTLLFSCLLGWLVYRWSRALYGEAGGLLSLSLYALSPNILAHARLITTDLYAALGAVAAGYTFWLYLKYGGWKRASVSALCLSLALLTKYTCLLLVPIFCVLGVFRLKEERAVKPGLGAYAALAVTTMLVVVNLAFLLDRSGYWLSAYQFQSSSFQKLQRVVDLPIPLPYPFLEGMDKLRYHEETGFTTGIPYLFGELRREGFYGYFLVAYLFKVPLATQLLVILALVGLVRTIKADEWFLLVPVLVLGLYFNLLVRIQIGFRFFLLVLPFLHILCGRLASSKISHITLRRKVALGALIFYQLVSVVSYCPHFLPYFNELVWDRKKAYTILADSNINWGQNRHLVARHLSVSPAELNPRRPCTGRVLVDVNLLAGIHGGDRYPWLRGIEPSGHVGYTHLIFEVPRREPP